MAQIGQRMGSPDSPGAVTVEDPIVACNWDVLGLSLRRQHTKGRFSPVDGNCTPAGGL